MAEIGEKFNLVDLTRRLDPGGDVAEIAEVLTESNPILLDMILQECNKLDGYQGTIRNGLPAAAWRELNYGVPQSKSTTQQITDTCGMLEAWSQLDKDTPTKNIGKVRYTENLAFVETMNQGLADTLIYGNRLTSPARFTGFMARFTTPSTDPNNIGFNMLDGGGIGADNTSMLLVAWNPRTVFGIYPEGSKAGLVQEDLNMQTVYDALGNPYRAYQTHYQWKIGLHVKNWKGIVRICNIDVSNLATAGDDTDLSTNLLKLMIRAIYRVPAGFLTSAAFYCNRDVMAPLSIKLLDKANNLLQMKDLMGPGGITRSALTFQGIPVRQVDAITSTEAAISGTFGL